MRNVWKEPNVVIDEFDVTCRSYKVDMGKKEQIFDFANQVEKDFSNVNFVFNNAGVSFSGSLVYNDMEQFEWLFNINFWGVVYGSQAFLPLLIKSGEGHIVNISSVLGLIGLAQNAAYCSSKFGVRGYTESLAQEMALEGHPVNVSCVHPGGVRTNIVKDSRVSDNINRRKLVDSFAKFTYLDADKAARIILKGVKKNKKRILVGPDAYVIDYLSRILGVDYQNIAKALARTGFGPAIT